MPSAKERLSHLLVLASEGPAQRATLVGELADMVLDWPADCAAAMQKPLLSLFALTVREADDETRAKLAARLGGHSELPLSLINEFYLSAPARVRREILTRNQFAQGDEADPDTVAADARALLAAARDAAIRDFAAAFGCTVGIPRRIAQSILSDASGEALAVLCKGTQLDRAMFSALVLLKGAGEAQLSIFDTVPQHAAERLARHWRAHAAPLEHTQAAAAE